MVEEPESHRAPISGHLESEPTWAAFSAMAAALALYVVAYPFTLVRYPPITDLPFHEAETSIFRHYFDPAFHFREQFSLHPLEVPYLSMYLLGALLALGFSIATATKLMAIVMLALVPIGLAVLFYGMNKDPLWGLLGLCLTWTTVTQWGFLNFMGAIGLYAMSVGYALLVVRRPTNSRRIGLAIVLVAIFFTHVFRLPFAILSVLLAGALVYPATSTFAPLVLPLSPSLVLFVLWLAVRPHGLGIGLSELGFHPERLREMGTHLFSSYLPIEGAPMTAEGFLEHALYKRMFLTVVFSIVTATVLFFWEGRGSGRTRYQIRWAAGVTALSVLLAGGLLIGYLTLPFESGLWFYVFPREIVASALLAMSIAPDLPRGLLQRLAFVFVFALASLPMSRFVSARFSEFEDATLDFRDVLESMPKAPRLLYLMYWLGGSQKRVSPFLHLPAWVQAEHGGTLAFHFVQWGHSPIRYRSPGPDVPPRFSDRFEWEPQHFRVLDQGPWFDTFLVRHRIDPQELFDADPTIHLTAHRGTWWLYRRTP